jgi:hypothetical protein
MTSRPQRLAFATALGFQVLMTCPSPQVEPAAAAVRDWCDLQHCPDGISVVPVSAVSVASLVDAWTTYYEWVHQPWAPITSREAVSASFEEQMLPTIGTTPSMVALHDQRIVALGFVSGPAWDGRTFIVAETVLADESRGDQVVASVTAAILGELARQHYALVEFEGHDSDPHIDVIKSIPALRHDPLTILITPNLSCRQLRLWRLLGRPICERGAPRVPHDGPSTGSARNEGFGGQKLLRAAS